MLSLKLTSYVIKYFLEPIVLNDRLPVDLLRACSSLTRAPVASPIKNIAFKHRSFIAGRTTYFLVFSRFSTLSNDQVGSSIGGLGLIRWNALDCDIKRGVAKSMLKANLSGKLRAHLYCEIVAGSPNEDLEQCFHVHDNSCATFVEENCSYNGTDTGTDISFILTYFPA